MPGDKQQIGEGASIQEIPATAATPAGTDSLLPADVAAPAAAPVAPNAEGPDSTPPPIPTPAQSMEQPATMPPTSQSTATPDAALDTSGATLEVETAHPYADHILGAEEAYGERPELVAGAMTHAGLYWQDATRSQVEAAIAAYKTADFTHPSLK